MRSFFVGVFLIVGVKLFGVDVGERLPLVVLEGENGGLGDKNGWSSQTLAKKVHILLYMDPDKRDEAMPFLDRLNKTEFPKQRYSTIAIVNLAATWVPDALLESILTKKQKDLKNTKFVFDKRKYLLKRWDFKDDDINILVLDKKMRVLYKKSGELSAKDQEEIFALVGELLK